MKRLILIAFSFLVAFGNVVAQDSKEKDKEKKPAFKIDQYWFVMIKTGPRTDFDSTARAGLFKGHMENMGRLHKEGILKVAGPFGKNDFTWRGIFILDCKTKEEAEKFVATDPAVSAGLFAVDIVPWYTEASGNFIHGKPEKLD